MCNAVFLGGKDLSAKMFACPCFKRCLSVFDALQIIYIVSVVLVELRQVHWLAISLIRDFMIDEIFVQLERVEPVLLLGLVACSKNRHEEREGEKLSGLLD